MPEALRKIVATLEGEAALVQRPEVPRAIQREMAALLSEAADIAQFQHEVGVPELEHEAAAAGTD